TAPLTTGGRKGWRERKGREAREIQKRDQVCNLFVHHTQDRQAKQLIHTRLGLPLVEPASRAAIGTRRKQTPRPCMAEERSPEQGGDRRSSLDPDRKRRHAEDSVLAQQRHESSDVVLLPQGHVSVKQGCSRGTRAGSGGVTIDVALLHSAPGPL